MHIVLYILLTLAPHSDIQIEMLPMPEPQYVLPIDRPADWHAREQA